MLESDVRFFLVAEAAPLSLSEGVILVSEPPQWLLLFVVLLTRFIVALLRLG
jgi:hypothetical protein